MGKADDLRRGAVVDWVTGDGKKTRAFLDKEKQKIQLATGESLSIPDEYRSELLPSSPEQERVAREKGKIRGQKNIYGETLGDLLHSFGDTGALGGLKGYLQGAESATDPLSSGQEGKSFLERIGENYAAKKQATQEISQEGFERSPIASYAGMGAELGAEVLNPLTKGVSSAKLLPALSVASKGPEAFTDPSGTFKDAAISSALGFAGDKLVNKLGQVASRRALSRQTAQDAERIGQANERGAAKYQQDVANTKHANELEKFGAQQANQRREQAIQQFQGQQQARQTQLDRIAQDQARAEELFVQGVEKNADKIGKVLGPNRTVTAEQLEIPKFLTEAVERSSIAGSREADQLTKFINTAFKDELTGSGLAQALKAVEKRIGSAQGEAQNILLSLKDHLAEAVPNAITETRIYRSLLPSIERDMSQSVSRAFSQRGGASGLLKEDVLQREMQNALNSYSKKEFVEAVRSGEISSVIDDALETGLRKSYIPSGKMNPQIGSLQNIISPADRQVMSDIRQQAQNRLGKKLSDYGIDISIAPETTRRQMGAAAQNLRGQPPQIPLPPPLQQPNIPPPASAQLQPPPSPFVPQPVPQMSAPQNLTESAGDFLENSGLGNLFRGRGGLDNPLTRMAGLKYLLGKAALPAEGGAAAGLGVAKAATSPTSIGEAIRFGVNKSPRFIANKLDNYFREKYPSYDAGILQNPQERLEAVAEVENSPYLKFEDKAYIQMKINRGKPLR